MDLVEEFDLIGCRRLWVLVNGLQPEAAIFRVEGQRWTTREELLAFAVERIDHWGLSQAYLASNKKFHKHLPDEPLQIPRPGRREKSDRTDRVITDSREIARFFG